MAAVYINGGAAVALLAFAGSSIGAEDMTAAQASALRVSLTVFTVGVGLAAFAMGVAYITQHFYSGAAERRHALLGQRQEHAVKSDKIFRRRFAPALIGHATAVIGGFLGLVSFFVGVAFAIAGLPI